MIAQIRGDCMFEIMPPSATQRHVCTTETAHWAQHSNKPQRKPGQIAMINLKSNACRALIAVALASLSGVLQAAPVFLPNLDVTYARLQNFSVLNGVPVLWYATSSAVAGTVLWSVPSAVSGVPRCANIAPTATDAKRFHDLVLIAKLTSAKIFIDYELTNCQVVDFGMDAP